MRALAWCTPVLFVLVVAAGISFQFLYAVIGKEAARIPDAGFLQGTHVALGIGAGVAAFLTWKKQPRMAPVFFYCVAYTLLGAAVAFGPLHNGLPYLVSGPLRIHSTEAFSLLACASVAALLVRRHESLEGFAAFVPIMVLSSVGGVTASWSYWLALAGVWSLVFLDRNHTAKVTGKRRPAGGVLWNVIVLVPALAVAALPLVRWLRTWPPAVGESTGAAAATAQTEHILGATVELLGMPAVAALLVAYGALLLCVLAQSLRSAPGLVRYLGAAWALHTVGQVGWLLAASGGLVPVPASGVVLPLVSHSGTFTLLSCAILTVVFLESLVPHAGKSSMHQSIGQNQRR